VLLSAHRIISLEGGSVTTLDTRAISARELVQGWLWEFESALANHDADAAGSLFVENGWWRDLLCFTWDLRTFSGTTAITAALEQTVARTQARGFALTDGKEPEFVDFDQSTSLAQAFFEFETALARGRGFVRLLPSAAHDGPWKAWTALTAMEELKGFEEWSGPRRPKGTMHGEFRGQENWSDLRHASGSYEHRDPQVLVVGAGQGGLTIAARLGRLGVDTLVVERNARIGDNWRKRYHSLVLHDPVWYDHMPYLPFPSMWPVFTPKDKLADWFESYASSMELDVWCDTELADASYDESQGRWTVELRGTEGTQTLRPGHLVLATGMSGEPSIPQIAGSEDFKGTLVHSSQHSGAPSFAGKKALVVGCCNSGHDIAQEFYEHGCDVTMLQRSSTYVMSSENGISVLFAGLYEEGGPPTEDADLIFASIPYPQLAVMHKDATKQIADLDRELLDGLEGQGFKIDYGADDSGLFMKYLRRGGGYYINVGCAELIAAGKVGVKQGVEIERLTQDGVVFSDGSTMSADVVVLATGFQNMRETARRLLGDAVADRCSPVWGLDSEGELQTMWRRSGHEGLWFMGGNLHQCRHYSKFLALQIKAVEEGLIAR
jgi:cation diffusion facilitator CzcD-associated flavoprotein CzcO